MPVLDMAPYPIQILWKVKQAPMPSTAQVSCTCPSNTRKMHQMGISQVEEEVKRNKSRHLSLRLLIFPLYSNQKSSPKFGEKRGSLSAGCVAT